METKHTKIYHSLCRYWWEITVCILSLLGILFGIIGFKDFDTSGKLYETFRLFLLNYQFEVSISPYLEISRWLIFLVFLFVSFKLFVTIIAPRFFQNKLIQYFYKDHIIICGLNETGVALIEQLEGHQIVIITNENNHYNESLKHRKVKTIISNIVDKNVLNAAKVCAAKRLYLVTNDDKKNIEIAYTAYSLLKKQAPQAGQTLKCYTLVKDKELKILLEESALFKYTITEGEQFFFDGILFNVNEMGIKYGISLNIEKILPQKIETTTEILIFGLTDKAENVILNLAHCLTMNRDIFRFTIMEECENTVTLFKKKYSYLHDFAKFEYINNLSNIFEYKRFTSIFICLEDQIEAIKKALSIRYIVSENQPNIIVFCNESDSLNKILNTKENNQPEGSTFPLDNRNIYLINPFAKIAHYFFDLEKDDDNIEAKAKKIHDFWKTKYKLTTEYASISEHFKQTNRNQILDNYLRTYIAVGEKFDFQRKGALIHFSDKDMETLAIMEHRRWMIEKYSNGWRYGAERNDEFKIHPCLQPWEKLPYKEKMKDYDAIYFMTGVLNKEDWIQDMKN